MCYTSNITSFVILLPNVCWTLNISVEVVSSIMELEQVTIQNSDFFDVDSHASTPLLSEDFLSKSEDDEIYYSAQENLDIEEKVIKFRAMLQGALEKRKGTIQELVYLKREIEESYDKSRKAKIGGIAAAIAGSTLGIAGFGLAFVTFGASLPLLIIGGVVGAAGGTTAAGADIGYTVVSHKRMKRVMAMCQEEDRLMGNIRELWTQVQENIQALQASRYPQYTVEQVLEIVVRRRLLSGTSIGHAAFKVGHFAAAAGDVAKVGAQIVARTTLRTAGVAAVAVGGVAVAMDAILIPIDLAFLVKAAIDIHKYNGGKGSSNSNAAKKVVEIITRLEENTKQMRSIQELL